MDLKKYREEMLQEHQNAIIEFEKAKANLSSVEGALRLLDMMEEDAKKETEETSSDKK